MVWIGDMEGGRYGIVRVWGMWKWNGAFDGGGVLQEVEWMRVLV